MYQVIPVIRLKKLYFLLNWKLCHTQLSWHSLPLNIENVITAEQAKSLHFSPKVGFALNYTYYIISIIVMC